MISGPGAVNQIGSGYTLLGGLNTATGDTTVSNGTLAVASQLGGNLNLYGGSFAAGDIGTPASVTVAGNLNMAFPNNSSEIIVSLNEALSPGVSNSVINVTGSITWNGNGTLRILNYGPAPTPGAVYKIFSAAIPGADAMPVLSPGMTVQNHLGDDGTVTVLTSAAIGTRLVGVSKVGTTLNVSWPAIWTGMRLQAQYRNPFYTNNATGINANNWQFVPGTETVNAFSTTLVQSNLYLRLIQP